MNQNQPQKLKTIKVQRVVEEEVLVKRKVKKDVQVELTDLTEDEIGSLPLEYTRAVAIGYKKLYQEILQFTKQELEALKAQNHISADQNLSKMYWMKI